ncbi:MULTISPECIES: hypothetical protein [Mameliella]|nr:hypothetical protein [Mameliella sp. LZ-28]
MAIRASAEIFGSLEDLRISRDFAISVFVVSGQDFDFVDTPDRARELGVTLTGTGPLPERIDRERIRDLCTAEFPSLGPAQYQDQNSGTRFAGDWILALPDSNSGARNWVYLSGTTAEGTLMIDACRVEWRAPHRIALRLFRDIQTDRGQ